MKDRNQFSKRDQHTVSNPPPTRARATVGGRQLRAAMAKIFPRGYDKADMGWCFGKVMTAFCEAVIRDGPPDLEANQGELKLIILRGDTRRVTVVEHKEV